ncbi:hypothetical protein [Stackebrandtia soli]|uniref:hypothetical protein n=1 Tax=Stackebrandtia soli TaxID=1892856 RepID=UPI0039EA3478
MADSLDAVAAEATTDPNATVLTRRLYGRTWRFGRPDIRPAKLRRYAALAEGVNGAEMSGVEAIELSAAAEDILRSALPAADRDAFDDAPFTGSDIGELVAAYFGELGVSPGESSASPRSSSRTRTRSRRTSKPRINSR